jgi:hypothetical protein
VDPESELPPEILGDEPVRLPRERDSRPVVPRRAPLRHARWWAGLAVLLVAGSVVVAVDGRSRAHEGDAVAGCEQQLRVATGYAEGRLGLVANYLEPTIATNGRVQQLHLADLMSARANKVLPRVQEADRYCRGVSVRPWHFSLVERQSASTAYSAALVTLVQTVAAQGRVPFRANATMQRLREEVGIGGG